MQSLEHQHLKHGGRKVVRPRFHLIYFALAAFDLLAVSLGLFLIDRISVIHRESVAVSQEWGQRLERYVDLLGMAAAVNGPGNDVFSSRDVAGESKRLAENHAAFSARVAELREELARNVEAHEASALVTRLDRVDAAMNLLVQRANMILAHFRSNDLEAAGQSMAAMDRQFVEVIDELSGFGALVGQLQRDHFQRQIAVAERWRKLEYVVAGLIVIMVVGVTMYGHTLSRRVKEAAQQTQDHLAALAEYKSHLEEMVEARTSQLKATHEQLRQADRLASIGALAAGLGHDMNNVLLPVRAHLNAFKALAGESTENRDHLDRIHKGVAYLQQLADGLHFLAMDPDKIDDAGGSTDLNEWWEQTGPLLSKAVPKHVKVMVSFPVDLPQVAVASHALTQAMLNLIVNAGEAIPGPPERIRRQGYVRLWARTESGGTRVLLGVSDNGAGMSEEVKRRAFDMFFTTKPRGLGTGLGLALVRKVADQAGGTVRLESSPGEGTTVVLDLPAVAPAATQRRVAVVTIADRRAASMIASLLEAGGAAAQFSADPNGADIWVVEPARVDFDRVMSLKKHRPGFQLVLFGLPTSGSPAASDAIDAITIKDPDDLEAVRAALGQALAATPMEIN